MSSTAIVQKLWNYCNVLRDDGMSYGDYPGSSPGQANNEQLTYLLFLKMADERAFLEHKALNSADSNSKVLLGCLNHGLAYHIRKRKLEINTYKSIACNHYG